MKNVAISPILKYLGLILHMVTSGVDLVTSFEKATSISIHFFVGSLMRATLYVVNVGNAIYLIVCLSLSTVLAWNLRGWRYSFTIHHFFSISARYVNLLGILRCVTPTELYVGGVSRWFSSQRLCIPFAINLAFLREHLCMESVWGM